MIYPYDQHYAEMSAAYPYPTIAMWDANSVLP